MSERTWGSVIFHSSRAESLKPIRERLKYSSDFGTIVWIDSPLSGEVFDIGSAPAADLPKSWIDKATSQGFSTGIRLEVLNMCPDSDLYALEGGPGNAMTGCPNPREVVLPAMDIAIETQIVRFEAHLAERHIMIDAFNTRLFDIVLCNG